MMMIIISLSAAVIGAYLIGAIPFSFLIAKANGVDLRKVGSGNIGATNVIRSCGKYAGILAYVADISKGIISVSAANFLIPLAIGRDFASWFLIPVGVAAILGHVFPVYLGFKGGKGVATSAGVMLILAPLPLAFSLLFFFAAFFISGRIISVGSTAAALALPAGVSIFYFTPELKPFFDYFYNDSSSFSSYLSLIIIASAITIFVIIKHIPNYKRLLKGEEHGFKK